MKNNHPSSVIRYSLSAAALLAAAALSGCSVNPDTGATELFGCIEISDTTLDVAETVADEAKSSGGIVGAFGILAGAAIAIYRRRKKADNES